MTLKSCTFALLVFATSKVVSAGYSSPVGARESVVTGIGGVEVEPRNLLERDEGHRTLSNTTSTNLIPSLLEWFENEGGMIHKSLDFRPRNYDDKDDWGTRIFATDSIPKGTNLLEIPKSALILADSGQVSDEEETNSCTRQKVARKLFEELQLGSSSNFAPYLQSVVDRGSKREKNRLPTALWSNAGQRILSQLLVRDRSSDDELNEEDEYWGMDLDLPPESFSRGLLGELLEGKCGATERHKTDDELRAFLLHHRFNWGNDEYLIPIYDMIEHRSGMLVNTMFEISTEAQAVIIKSSREILQGEELFGSHYQHVNEAYGTPELFRDYGFVEDYPQRFIFHHTDVAFVLDHVEVAEDDDEDSKTTDFQVKWLWQRPYDEDIEFLSTQYERLTGFFFETRRDEIAALPAIEQKLLRLYHETLVNAIGAAIEAYEDESTCILSEGSCYEYDRLEETPDNLDYQMHTCNTSKILGFEGYSNIDGFQTPYQNATFFRHPETRDTCFDLDKTVQVCDSYRPVYHESAVQYAVRYIEKLERALFVGGGDSMLLHELLKYDSIKKIVGLELDQKVTRYSFKHFGTQPHWDNEKVEWWYGDATKSLSMLPKYYFGSFDLVIVDLSETVMSFPVTNSLDIFGALALLLKPKGILVKNEIYLQRFAELFDYSVQAIVYDAPVVCSQAMVFGSYGTDFFRQNPKEVEVDTLLLHNNDAMEAPNAVWHDYVKNRTRVHPGCAVPDESTPEPFEDQTESPGIIMIVDIEDASRATLSPNGLNRIFTKILTNRGLSVVSGMATAAEDVYGEPTAIVSVVLEEGYIMGRVWPKRRYCALDIHLWGSFDKQDTIRKALVTALGGSPRESTSSAYRIVAGGMYGVKFWQENEYSRGPPTKQSCKSNQLPVEEDKPLAPLSVVSSALNETISLFNTSGLAVAVFCATEQEQCLGLDVISKSTGIRDILPIWACPNLERFDIESGFGMDIMDTCQREVLRQLVGFVTSANAPISAIILDSTAPYGMGQVLAKVLSATPSLVENDDFMIVSASPPNESEVWRRALLDRFRHDIIVRDSVFRAEVLLISDDDDEGILQLGITRSGDAGFIPHLSGALSRIEDQTGMVADVQTIRGGLLRYQEDNAFHPTVFHNSDYDKVSPVGQWMSQEPMGFQTIFQLEPKHWTSYIQAGDRIEVYFESEGFWDPGYVTEISPDGLLFDVALDDGTFEQEVHANYIRATSAPDVTVSALNGALVHALDSIVQKEGDEDAYLWKSFSSPQTGEGSVAIAFWKGGSLAVLWDGREHIDVNLFTFEERVEIADAFMASFGTKLPFWTTVLRDEQPRGTGRVVNYQRDLGLDESGERLLPHWA